MCFLHDSAYYNNSSSKCICSLYFPEQYLLFIFRGLLEYGMSVDEDLGPRFHGEQEQLEMKMNWAYVNGVLKSGLLNLPLRFRTHAYVFRHQNEV